jgi:hypothetical protein
MSAPHALPVAREGGARGGATMALPFDQSADDERGIGRGDGRGETPD